MALDRAGNIFVRGTTSVTDPYTQGASFVKSGRFLVFGSGVLLPRTRSLSGR
ncbi:MAG: hypothetical protein ABI995_16095 [Acidobacteriota bacterium]